jgi:four helix bundle protein
VANGGIVGRDVNKLTVFHVADELVLTVYKVTAGFPPEERYGLQSQMRRAAVSTASDLVEGCTRRSTRDYLRFVELSLGSASEVRYLVTVARRLHFLTQSTAADLTSRYTRVVQGLQKLIAALENQP